MNTMTDDKKAKDIQHKCCYNWLSWLQLSLLIIVLLLLAYSQYSLCLKQKSQFLTQSQHTQQATDTLNEQIVQIHNKIETISNDIGKALIHCNTITNRDLDIMMQKANIVQYLQIITQMKKDIIAGSTITTTDLAILQNSPNAQIVAIAYIVTDLLNQEPILMSDTQLIDVIHSLQNFKNDTNDALSLFESKKTTYQHQHSPTTPDPKQDWIHFTFDKLTQKFLALWEKSKAIISISDSNAFEHAQQQDSNLLLAASYIEAHAYAKAAVKLHNVKDTDTIRTTLLHKHMLMEYLNKMEEILLG